jgi:cytochrome o ubiquinol oxidase subunit IV
VVRAQPATDPSLLPAVPAGLAVLAIAQMGVHLLFFLHIDMDADHTNNVLALAFGVLIVALVVAGSLWIMDHLNTNMVSPSAAWRRGIEESFATQKDDIAPCAGR